MEAQLISLRTCAHLSVFLTKKLKKLSDFLSGHCPPSPPGTDGHQGAQCSVEDQMVPARRPRPCLCAAEAQGVRFKYNCTGADICMAGRRSPPPRSLSLTHTEASHHHTHTHTPSPSACQDSPSSHSSRPAAASGLRLKALQ